jgi:two-component system cell cycle response regulator DivK
MHENKQEKQIVLVVEGDTSQQFFACVFLQRLNYHAFPVKTAEEALRIMELTVPLLVMTELVLPLMSGIDLLRTIKQDPRISKVPVLIYTSDSSPSSRQACEQAGCAGYLTRPADHNQVYAAVQRATENTPRHFVRLATQLDVIVESGAAAGGGEKKEKVTAISEDGMYVSMPNPLPIGSMATFTLFLDRALAWGIRVEGTVRCSDVSNDPAKLTGIGVKFTQIRPEDKASIRTFIEKKLMEGIEVVGKVSPGR